MLILNIDVIRLLKNLSKNFANYANNEPDSSIFGVTSLFSIVVGSVAKKETII